MRSLRGRLILSHILPLLLVLPLVGVALVYGLETRVVLANAAQELAGQGVLVAEIAGGRPEIWQDPAAAQDFAARMASRLGAQVMLLDAQGRVWASSDPGDADRIGQRLADPELSELRAGETRVRTLYTADLRTEVAEAVVPVAGAEGQVVGMVRLSHELGGIYGRFLRLRSLVGLTLMAAVLVGSAVGLALALSLETPLRRLSEAVYGLAAGEDAALLPEEGPAEVRLLLQAYNTLVARLHGLEQARRQLLANLVHELGRPLGALHSAVQALLRGADQDPALRRELLSGMEGEIHRLERLLEDLARLRERILGGLELAARPLPLRDWLVETLAPWESAAAARGLRWQLSLPEALPQVVADPDRLGQALGNLLSNALRYTPPGGAVSVQADVEGDWVWIRVRDTGPGIPVEDQTRLFRPFVRGSAGERFPQGMGLGLYIARELALAHGGRLELESAAGQGACFTLWLPLGRPSPPQTSRA